MQRIADVVLDRYGRPIAGAQVLVKTLAGAVATLHATNWGAVIANPVTADNLGRYAFYAADGRYKREVWLNGVLLVTDDDLLLEDPADSPSPTLTQLAAAGGTDLVGHGNETLTEALTRLEAGQNIPALRATFTGDGVATAFTLPAAPISVNNVTVHFDAAYQAKDGYSVAGTTLTFASAPPSGVAIEVLVTQSISVSTANAENVTLAPVAGMAAATVQAALAELNSGKAPLASPALTGSPTAPTPAQFNRTTRVPTTEFVQRALGNAAGITEFSSSGGLTAADFGKSIVYAGGSAGTITLPSLLPSGSIPAGSRLEFVNFGVGALTVQRNDAAVIYPGNGSVTSLTLGTGDTLVLQANGGTDWQAVDGTARNKYAALFGASLSANGYQKLPSGLIIQWFEVTTSASSDIGATFPIAFPNQLLQITGSYQNTATGSTNVFASFGYATASAVNISGYFTSGARAAAQLHCIAIGY